MKFFRSYFIPAAAWVFLMLASSNAMAADYRTPWLEDPKPPHTKWTKLGRGFANVGLGWTEIAYQPFYMGREGNHWAVAAFGGIARGYFYALGRFFTGIYEVFFFPFENPGGGYGPLIEPEIPIPREPQRH